MKKPYIRFEILKDFIRSDIKSLIEKGSVLGIASNNDSIGPEIQRKRSGAEHGSCYFTQRSGASFNHSILKWSVRSREIVCDSPFG